MRKPFSFILASGNAHKAEEFAELLSPEIVKVEAAEQKLDVVEDGESFQANALLKAQAYYQKFKVPVMADDSGLVVEALPGELGIHSARFGGEGLSDTDRVNLLLEKLKGVEERSAYFVCQLCCYFSPKEIYFFEGRLSGEIGHAPKGEHGFGYDPVFIPTKAGADVSFASDPEFKAKYSHRAVACQHAQSFFTGLNETVDKS
ncbi:MAG: non-canonical purine NTP pyrophosphatase [Halobacteriovorax sp.]|nr:non-canonical purine NTP pyrophosphatase [Halobacteriovorax sp.]|tara:strand:+ start:321 stop:929 length:609 start_codon:yes stop_codon:yes gene_type:complete